VRASSVLMSCSGGFYCAIKRTCMLHKLQGIFEILCSHNSVRVDPSFVIRERVSTDKLRRFEEAYFRRLQGVAALTMLEFGCR
jgi:hypothetical protein